jgi:cell division inhibitor SepF
MFWRETEMANAFKNFFTRLGFGPDEIEDEGYDEEEYYIDEEVIDVGNRAKKKHVENVVNLPNSGVSKIVQYHPLNIEDAQYVVDNLKSRKPVVVSLVGVDSDMAQRIIDFLSGTVYALNGTLSKVSGWIYIVAPSSCEVISDETEFNKYSEAK